MRRILFIVGATLLAIGSDRVHAVGCVTNQNSVLLDSSATLDLQLGGTTPCTGYDEYSVGGTLTLVQPTLDVTLTNGFVPAAGESFTILSWGSLSGTFGTVTLPALSAGLTWNTSALYTTGTISVGSSESSAPMPLWALGVLGAGFLGIASRRLRKTALSADV
jgi:hypothetical protein